MKSSHYYVQTQTFHFKIFNRYSDEYKKEDGEKSELPISLEIKKVIQPTYYHEIVEIWHLQSKSHRIEKEVTVCPLIIHT